MNTIHPPTGKTMKTSEYREHFLACEARGESGSVIQREVMHTLLAVADVQVLQVETPYARALISVLRIYAQSVPSNTAPVIGVPIDVMLPLLDIVEGKFNAPEVSNVVLINDYRDDEALQQIPQLPLHPADLLVATV